MSLKLEIVIILTFSNITWIIKIIKIGLMKAIMKSGKILGNQCNNLGEK